MSDLPRTVGSGVVVGTPAMVTGVARFVAGIETVLELMASDVSGTILIVEDAAATGVAPIIGDALGIVCTSGGPTSHLALVAKEFGVPCIMAAVVTTELASLDHLALTMGTDGSLEASEP